MYSVALYRNESVYLTGGEGCSSRYVSILSIRCNEWQNAPKMKKGRCQHASLCLGNHVYVFGGKENRGSIESLKIGLGETWKEICGHSELTRRERVAVTATGPETIAIFGGRRDNESELKNGYELNTSTNEVRPILGMD